MEPLTPAGSLTLMEKRYYFDKKGIMQRGWLKLKGKKYYLDEDGIMQTGTVTVDGQKYKLASEWFSEKIDGKKMQAPQAIGTCIFHPYYSNKPLYMYPVCPS